MSILSIFLIYLTADYSFFGKTDNFLNSIIYTILTILISLCLSFSILKFRSGKKMVIEFKNMLPDLTMNERFLVAFMSGIGEELFFRGLLLPLSGLLISTILFGGIHYPVKKYMKIWTIFALIMGFLLGILCEKTNSILFPILAHILVNFIGFNIINSIKNRKNYSKKESAI